MGRMGWAYSIEKLREKLEDLKEELDSLEFDIEEKENDAVEESEKVTSLIEALEYYAEPRNWSGNLFNPIIRDSLGLEPYDRANRTLNKFYTN